MEGHPLIFSFSHCHSGAILLLCGSRLIAAEPSNNSEPTALDITRCQRSAFISAAPFRMSFKRYCVSDRKAGLTEGDKKSAEIGDIVALKDGRYILSIRVPKTVDAVKAIGTSRPYRGVWAWDGNGSYVSHSPEETFFIPKERFSSKAEEWENGIGRKCPPLDPMQEVNAEYKYNSNNVTTPCAFSEVFDYIATMDRYVSGELNRHGVRWVDVTDESLYEASNRYLAIEGKPSNIVTLTIREETGPVRFRTVIKPRISYVYEMSTGDTRGYRLKEIVRSGPWLGSQLNERVSNVELEAWAQSIKSVVQLSYENENRNMIPSKIIMKTLSKEVSDEVVSSTKPNKDGFYEILSRIIEVTELKAIDETDAVDLLDTFAVRRRGVNDVTGK